MNPGPSSSPSPSSPLLQKAIIRLPVCFFIVSFLISSKYTHTSSRWIHPPCLFLFLLLPTPVDYSAAQLEKNHLILCRACNIKLHFFFFSSGGLLLRKGSITRKVFLDCPHTSSMPWNTHISFDYTATNYWLLSTTFNFFPFLHLSPSLLRHCNSYN